MISRKEETRRKKPNLEWIPFHLSQRIWWKGTTTKNMCQQCSVTGHPITVYTIQNLEEKKPRPLVKASTGACKLDKRKGITKMLNPSIKLISEGVH